MKSTRLVLFSVVLLLIGCSSIQSRNHITTNVNNGYETNTISHKRINTTDCKDADDWYLDGYRVGKSFTAQRKEMFDQRLGFCNLTVKKLPNKFRKNWEKGFSVGSKG